MYEDFLSSGNTNDILHVLPLHTINSRFAPPSPPVSIPVMAAVDFRNQSVAEQRTYLTDHPETANKHLL